MNFQDTLKSNIREKSEVDAENKKQRQDELSKRASNTVATAKSYLLNEAKNGNHTTLGEKTIITANIPLHPEFFSLTVKKKPGKYRRTLLGQVVSTKPAMIVSTFDIDPIMREDFQFFLSCFRSFASTEGIVVKDCFVEHNVKHTKGKLPYTVEDMIFQLFKHEWMLKVEVEATI